MRIIGNRGNTARKVQAVASGALASGDTVVVNSDGTVSVVGVTGPEITSATVWLSATNWPLVQGAGGAVDTANGKFILAYRHVENSNYGTCVVATISGTTLTFGTPVVFASATTTGVSCVYDVSTDRVVIVFKDNSNSGYGTAIIGAVNSSNNSISFGSETVFASETADGIYCRYDATNSKVAIMWAGGGSVIGRGIIGTVTASGNSISFGSATNVTGNSYTSTPTFDYITDSGKFLTSFTDSGGILSFQVGTVSGSTLSFSSEAEFAFASGGANNGSGQGSAAPQNFYATYVGLNKFLVPYKKVGTGTDGSSQANRGAAVVVTVDPSNNSMSFGSEVIFESAEINRVWGAAYDPIASKAVVIYNKSASPYIYYYAIVTVSGTTPSFATSVEYNQGSNSDYPRITFDSVNNQMIIPYSAGTTNGSYRVLKVQGTNLTSENYIGIASNGYATGQAATINAKGFIDDNQSSLTAGQSYYVQTNGDLGLTAADPSVFAGTAVSATKLIVKG